MVDLIYLIGCIVVWVLVMEMNSNQDAIWSFYVKDKMHNRKLHRYDAVAIAALGIILAFGYRGVTIESVILGLFFFFMRSGYFSWRMNMKRLPKRMPWNHLGSTGWDSLFQGNNTVYFLTCFAGIVSSLIWLLKEYV